MNWIFATASTEKEVANVLPDLQRPMASPLRLVYAGRLSEVKGVLVLAEALRWLAEKKPELLGRFQLTVAGDGEQRRLFEESVRKVDELAGAVHFVGQLNRAALIATLSHADVCVIPSLSESFCKARVESMLCGTPILTTEVGFGRELAGVDGERGWVVSAGNAAELAHAIANIMETARDWPALRRRCHEFAKTLTLEAWAAKIGSLCALQWKGSLLNGKLVF
jgi:glycosyltransferase involved in cell wall biosynthesis